MSEHNKVSVFTAPSLKGTEAVVYLLDSDLNDSEMLQIAQKEATPATCFVWLNAQTPSKFNIRFFNSTKEIQVCGHGLLAAARVVAEHNFGEFQFLTQKYEIQIKTDSDGSVWVSLPEIDSESCDIPAWATDCFNKAPISAAKAGPDDGYWVFEWSQDFALQSLAVDYEKLAAATERAVIATQQAKDEHYDYYLRYFAPQHGVNEDRATGSANRVLINYWHKKLNQGNFIAQQLSKDGAELKGRLDDGLVWISGNVTIDS